MKWTLSFIAALSLTAPLALAREISSVEAGRAAAAWVRRDRAPLGTALSSADVADVSTTVGDDDAPIFHVVRMAGGGVVVTSAESGVTPVVAFFDGDALDEDNPLQKILNADMALRTRQVLAIRDAAGMAKGTQGTGGTRGKDVHYVLLKVMPEQVW